MATSRVLIVDNDPALVQSFVDALKITGVAVETVDSVTMARDRIVAQPYDAIVTDVKMPGMGGLGLLAEIRSRWPGTPVIVTGNGDEAPAIGALNGGIYEFIEKPIDRNHLVASLRRAIQTSELSRRVKEQQVPLERRTGQLEPTVEECTQRLREANKIIESPLGWLISPSRQIEKIAQQIRQVADSPLTVLVEGETGTGKELTARAIHHLSARRTRPFVAVDCGAIPETLIESELFGYEKGAFTGAHQRKEGHFQLASNGSLFLDEIVNLPLPTQAKLLRALQERQVQPLGGKRPSRVDARIIAASNVPLARQVCAGRFRQDVYYRLNEFVITLPPLRDRDDILHLANRFLAEATIEFGRFREISDAAAQVLLKYPWPGNVRELRNVIRRAILLAPDVIGPEHLAFLPVESSPPIASRDGAAPTGRSLKEVAEAAAADAEQQAIRRILQTTKGNKSEAARLLRTDYKTLHVKMKQYGISAAQFKDPEA